MSDQQREHDSARAPSGTGAGGSTDRPIPADRQAGGAGPSTGENTPQDGGSGREPHPVDGDALRFGDGVAGVDDQAADGAPTGERPPAGDESAAEDAAADADQASEDAAEAAAAVDAEPVAEEEPDWKDRYVRSVAELDNVRKRARRDVAQAESRGVGRLAKELLPALDNLDRALAHVDGGADDPDGPSAGDAQLVEGLRIVHREIHAALSSAGITAYDPLGEPFDPHAHEALTQQPAPEGTEPGTIIAVYQAGYRKGDDVLRAAKVVVAG